MAAGSKVKRPLDEHIFNLLADRFRCFTSCSVTRSIRRTPNRPMTITESGGSNVYQFGFDVREANLGSTKFKIEVMQPKNIPHCFRIAAFFAIIRFIKNTPSAPILCR